MLGVNHKKDLSYPNPQHIYALSFENFIRAFFRSGVVAGGGNRVRIVRHEVSKRLAMRPALARVALGNPMFSSVLLSIIGWTTAPIDAPDVTSIMTKLRRR